MAKRRGVGVPVKLGLILFTAYATVTLVSLQIQIEKKNAEKELLLGKAETQEMRNSEISAIIENGDDEEYISKIARDKLGYIIPGEKVFVNIGKK